MSAAHGERRNIFGHVPLSEEMLHSGAGGAVDRAITLAAAARALKARGQCLLELWPYGTALVGGAVGIATTDAATRLAVVSNLSNFRYGGIRPLIAAGVPVVSVIPVCPAFFAPQDGLVATPTKAEVLNDYHAVLLTDCVDEPSLGTLIEFRNSWGSGWGDDGYGFLRPDYLDIYAVAAAIIQPL